MEVSRKGRRNSSDNTDGHRLHAFGVAPVGIGGYVGEVVLTRVAFPEHDTTIPCQMAKSNAPRTFFRFFSAARPDGRAVGFGLCGSAAKKSPRHRLTFARTPTAGGELRRGYRRLTTPPCVLKHHAPWRCGAHITYIMSS